MKARQSLQEEIFRLYYMIADEFVSVLSSAHNLDGTSGGVTLHNIEKVISFCHRLYDLCERAAAAGNFRTLQ